MRLIILIVLLLGPVIAHSQQITSGDFRAIIPALSSENYRAALDMSASILERYPNDTSEAAAQLRYVSIYAAAGLVSIGVLSHDSMAQAARLQLGKMLVMPGHPFVDSTKHVNNSFQITRKNGILTGSTTTTNKAATWILLFEYFTFKGPVDSDELQGNTVRCRGILESVETNPNKSRIWIARVRMSEAVVRVFTPR